MLDYIRQKSTSAVVLVIFGIIILVFVFWGMNPGGQGTSERVVATINGIDISVEAYDNLYKRELEKIKEQARGELTDDLLESLQLDRRVLNMLINDVLIVEEARNQGIEATDGDVQAHILANPVFKKDGAFDKEYYLELLRQNRLNPLEYEEGLRGNLTAQKMWKNVVEGVTFTDAELWEKYSSASAMFSYDYVEFNPEKFMVQGKVPEDALNKFYNENKTSFPVATTIRAFYARAGFKALGTQIEISAEDIKKYYEANTYDYLAEMQVRASHILIKDAGDTDAAKIKADDIYARLKAGEDFAALAKENSDDPGSAAKGGDLGFFGPGLMVKQFEDAAFSLGEGEISEPIKTSFGYHIIKVSDVKEEGVKPLSEVSGGIREILLKAQTAFAARDSIESLQEAFAGNDDIKGLEVLAAELSLETVTTGLLSEDATQGVLLRDMGLKNAAFGLNTGGVSAPVETEDGIYLIKIIERVESHVATFEEAKTRVEKSYRKEKSIEKARAEADGFLERVVDGDSFDVVIKEKELIRADTGFVIRERAFIEKLGLYIGDMEGLFKLTADAPYYSEIVPYNNAFYVFMFSGSKTAERAPFDANKEAIRARYLSLKREEAQNSWLDGLREKSDIKVNQDFF